MSANNPFDDPFFKNTHADFSKTVKRGFAAAILVFLLNAVLSLGALVGLIWFVIYLLHHYHVFN